MDLTKPSLSYRAPYVNNGGENETAVDEPGVPWRDAWEGERQRETETKETEPHANGTAPPAETLIHRKGSADKHRFNTLGYQRRTRQKVVTDIATVSKAASVGVKPRAALRQVLFNQGVSEKNPTPEDRGQLDLLKQSLQAFPVPVDLRWRWEEKLLGTKLEKGWTELVHSHSTMSKMQRHQQEALWEFLHTELTYINKLTVIKDLVIAALVNLHQHGFLLEVTPELLFSNLPSILSAHRLFWQEVMYPMLREVRRTGKPFDPLRLEAGCLQFHKRFSSYLPYCWEEEDTLEFTRREMDTKPHFFTYVQWVETHPQCERMRLGDMQAKPHQRITKYPLLLKAVLKTTQDLHVQHSIRHMLSSVNVFLESINDYMRLKDEELALSISAQRVEGYVVEGINEEIDKHVREVCQFDLTCPMKGVDPGIVRKLLLEENLKVRVRKDSKLEVVVALLFSDVLLITKVQKKAERLKVVRPPLALDRSHCSALRDGSSFVLVEVSELGCAMNVYIFSTASPESCPTWVSTIHQAQETLKGLRETENNRQMDSQKLQQSETMLIAETNIAHKDQIKHPLKKSGNETFVDNLIEEPVFAQSVSGMLTSRVTETAHRHSDPKVTSNGPGLQQHKFSGTQRKSAHASFARRALKKRQEMEGREWIEMGLRGDQQWEQEEFVVEFRGIKERKATWNHNRQSASELSNGVLPTDEAKPFRSKPSGPHSLLIGGVYPDVDYPMPQSVTSLPPYREHQTLSSMRTSEFQGFPAGAGGRSLRRHSESRPVYQEPRRDSWHGHSAEEGPPSDSWSFSSKLRSPRLRRRRPISSHHGAPPQMSSQQQLRGSGAAVWSAHANSSSNSDSDCNHKLKGHSVSSSRQNTDSHLVLKLGSLKQLNHRVLWDAIGDRVSPDLQNLSEPEQPNDVPEQNSQTRRPKLKAQRSASIPDLVTHGGQGLRHESRKSSLPRMDAPPYPALGLNPRARTSTLVGLLERAKERGQTNGKLHANVKTWNRPPSPSFSTTPSQSPSEGDRDTEWEEVEVMRCRAPTVSKGWREQLVDGDEDEKRSSSVFADGVNVDWSGWCFDDEEVMDHLNPGDYTIGGGEGLLEGISRSLTAWDMKRFTEQEEGECSQV